MVTRWTLHDPVTGADYTFPRNPERMGSIHPERNLTPGTTTAVDGQALLTEGNREPHPWKFEGHTIDYAHYAALEEWYMKPNRVLLTEHFGRSFYVVFRNLIATPQRRFNRYWRHTYEMDCFILTTPTAPTVEVA